MMPLISTLIQIVVVLALAPFALGLVRTFKARLQGRRGASPFLPYISFATLLRKQMVISRSTSWVFRVVPFVVLFSSVFLALVMPLVSVGGALAVYGNFVVVAGVMAFGAVFLVLGGLDVASAFGGMGASREMTISSLLEPTIIMTFATLAIVGGSFDLDTMLASGKVSLVNAPYLIFSALSLALILLAENARYPVDNPATHLELTMVHEAMILEYSGPYLAMVEYASALKLTVFALFLANLVLPRTFLINPMSGLTAVLVAIVFAFLKIVVGMFFLALLETTIAKMRFYRMQEYLAGAYLISLAGLIMALITRIV